MTLVETKRLLNQIDRSGLTHGEGIALSSYKRMLHNIREEGVMGGESHVQPTALDHAAAFARKHGAN